MEERMVKAFNKEEEFLNEFGDAAIVAANLLNREWQPYYSADDLYRSNLKYFFSTKEVKDLAFDTAYVYHMDNRCSSVQIILKSSSQVITVRVKMIDDKLIAEKILEKATE